MGKRLTTGSTSEEQGEKTDGDEAPNPLSALHKSITTIYNVDLNGHDRARKESSLHFNANWSSLITIPS